MSYGEMNTFIRIIRPSFVSDTEGFKREVEETLASVRAYREGRHGSQKWANRAAFTTATDLFRFRIIPNLEITTDMKIAIDGHCFEIQSIEDVKGKKMYIEVLAKEVTASG